MTRLKTPADRLRWALDNAWEGSNAAFQRALKAREVPGSSYAQVYRYLGGETDPPAAFLREAAQELGVREAWLIAGEGAPTREAVRVDARRAVAVRKQLEETDSVAILEACPGEDATSRRRRAALLRFGRKLDDASLLDPPWSGAREDLLLSALRFLEGVDDAFGEAADDLGLVLRSSAAEGWWVTWYDAALDLFARRVYGLGERSGGFHDSHSPASPRRTQPMQED